MMFYKLTSDSSNKNKSIYKDATFQGYDTEICSCCGRIIHKAKYSSSIPLLVLQGGTKNPDYLQFCSCSPRGWFVSERTIDIFLNNSITGFKYTPVNILKNDSDLVTLKYFLFTADGIIDVDYKAMHLKKKNLCLCCSQYELSRQRLGEAFLDESTWNGYDINSLGLFPNYLIVTERVVELIKKYKLTGFSINEQKNIFLPLKAIPLK